MKRITLKEVTHTVDTREGPKASTLNYRETIMNLLKTPKDPDKGATFEEMAKAIPIFQKFDKLSKDAKKIDLEDAEHEFVVDCLKNTRFNQRTVELFEMIKSVDEAVHVPPKG